MFFAERCNFTFVSSFPVYWSFCISCFVALAQISSPHAMTSSDRKHPPSGVIRRMLAFCGFKKNHPRKVKLEFYFLKIGTKLYGFSIQFGRSDTHSMRVVLALKQWFLWRLIQNIPQNHQENLLPLYPVFLCGNRQWVRGKWILVRNTASRKGMAKSGCVYGTWGAVVNTSMWSRTSSSSPALLTFSDLCSRKAFHISEVFPPVSHTVNENS